MMNFYTFILPEQVVIFHSLRKLKQYYSFVSSERQAAFVKDLVCKAASILNIECIDIFRENTGDNNGGI